MIFKNIIFVLNFLRVPDNDIIHKFIIGDMKAFEQIFRKYARSMQLTALSIYRDTDVAEDAVQETFVYLLKR